MPRGSSFENIHSVYRETHGSTSNANSLGSARSNRTNRTNKSNRTADCIGSDRGDYSNIPYDSTKNLILAKFFNSTGTNDSAYENLCSGCGYGVFEARGKLCNFCQYVINGYLEDNSNIYENICDKCSEVYSGDECVICCSKNTNNGADKACRRLNASKSTQPQQPATTTQAATTTTKKLKKRLFHSLLGSLKRVKSFNVPVSGASTTTPNDNGKPSIRKLDIVHNVDGYDNVFRTNETFDLSRICELKRLKSSTSDHHIYGKLRTSDDHLQTPYACVKQKSQSDDYLIGGTGCEPLFRRCTSANSHDSLDNNDDDEPGYFVRNSVSVWMTSLRCETHDYYSFGAPDTGVCTPKSIPAASFGVDGASSLSSSSVFAFYSNQVSELTDVTLRSSTEESHQIDFAQQMVNEFKRSLMEKQQAHNNQHQHLRQKRQGIYLKLDGIEESKQRNYHRSVDLVGDDRNCLSPSAVAAQSQYAGIELTAGSESSRRGVAHQLNKRCCIYEKDSEFVSDILQVFDSYLQRESETITTTDVVDQNTNQVYEVKSEENELAPYSLQDPNEIVFEIKSPPPLDIDIKQILHHSILSKCLNTIVISYARPLKVFLSGIDQSAHLARLDYPKLFKIFIRFEVFLSKNKRVIEFQTVSSDHCHPARSLVSENIPQISEVHSNRDLIATEIMTVPPGTAPPATKDHDDDEEEPIYQTIWKFKTVGEVQEDYITDEYYDHLPRTCESSAASIAEVDIEDHDEWEPDDEFTFTTKLDADSCKEPDTSSINTIKSSSSSSASGSTITGYASSISTMTIASTVSVTHHYFRNICIFYSPKEPKIRAVLYDYDRNQCSSYFAQQQQQPPMKQIGRGLNSSTTTSADYSSNFNCSNQLKKPSESGGRMFPDSVQAWKYMLLDVNYLEDEEDMIVSESQILKAQAVKEMDSSPPQAGILQRFKSISSGNLLDVPAEEDKKSITERVRNKFQRGVFKLSPKENKKGRKREAKSVYAEDGLKPKYPIFNAPLEQLEMNETSYPGVPRFVVDCIEYIEQKDCIQMDGLYRASGNKLAIDELKQKLINSYIYDPKLLVPDDIHTLTSLLKLFFRELGSPLIPQETYQKLASTRNLMDTSAIDILKNAFKDMKNPNHATLKFLIKHLTTVAHYSSENRMPASNLAIVWGPCILSANQIVYDIARMNTLAKVLIENYDQIFGDNERLVS